LLVDQLAQLTVLTITLKSASDLLPNEVTGLYDLARQTGFPLENGYLERAHFEHNPTLVLAHQGQQLVGFQSYNAYRLKPPFSANLYPSFTAA